MPIKFIAARATANEKETREMREKRVGEIKARRVRNARA